MKILTCLLILALVGSALPLPAAAGGDEPKAASRLEALKRIYPDARVYQVTPEEFGRIEPVLRELEARGDVAVIQLAQLPNTAGQFPQSAAAPAAAPALTNAAAGATNAVTNQVQGVSERAPGGRVPASRVSESRPVSQAPDGHAAEVFVRIVGDVGHIDGSSREFAIVIFVIVAAVVVVAIVAYAGVVLYDLLSGAGQYAYWWDIEAQASMLAGAGSEGGLFGAKLSTGVQDRDTRVGLVLEGGQLDARVHLDRDSDRVDVNGAFLMGGVGIRWGIGGAPVNPAYFGMELLAGGSSADNVDLMSTARMELSFGVGSRMRVGFSLGALYLGLNPTEGILKDYDQFSTLLGVQSGFRF
jgi:hypothetical protein